MIVEADPVRHEVTLQTDAGRRIPLSWAAAVNFGSLLDQKGHEAEPNLAGKRYRPTAGRGAT